MQQRHTLTIIILCIIIAVLVPAGLFAGSVHLDCAEIWQALTGDESTTASFIINENRLPALITALLAGASLAVAGLLMQTCFDNPLAGPSIMGISSGASLGVAAIMLGGGIVTGFWGKMAVASGAFAGAMAVLGVLLFFSAMVRSAEVLLIIGILIGYLASSAIALLNFFAPDRAIHSYMVWGMGTFNAVGPDEMTLFAPLCIALCLTSALYIKSLNTLLFGAEYARSTGLSLPKVRSGLLALAGALTAVVTAWCGPIGFIGLAVPHIARILVASSNHRILLPATLLCGAITGLLCQILSVAPGAWYNGVLPVNAITPVMGVPVILYVLLNRRKLLYFN